MIRNILEVDEALCDGCGLCVPACAEGALAVVGGKLHLTAEILCDGMGACLGECPRGALSLAEREAAPFDAARAEAARSPAPPEPACPGASPRALPRRGPAVLAGGPGPGPSSPSRGQSPLSNWPVQLALAPVAAPSFAGADLLVAADCVPFACPTFHGALLQGRALVIGCPKLDDLPAYADKLARIIGQNDPRSVTVARMEVPCCSALAAAARQAVSAAGREIPVREVVAAVDGTLRG